jgi:hypothetical protein
MRYFAKKETGFFEVITKPSGLCRFLGYASKGQEKGQPRLTPRLPANQLPPQLNNHTNQHQFNENCTVTPEFTVVIGNDCDVFGTVLR